MRVFVALALLLAPAVALADEWAEFRSGPFQVVTSGDMRFARETLNTLEQLRHVLGADLEKPDLKTVWPVRVVILRGKSAGAAVAPTLARDAYLASLAEKATIPQGWMARLVRILIDENAERTPASIESGLVAFFSTIQTEATIVTIGAPPPAPQRDLAWAKIQMLHTNPEYSGKIRVLLGNLQHGADAEAAYRNAFAKTPAQIDKEAAAYLAAGQFATALANSRPINPQRDFGARPFDDPLPAITLADLKLAAGDQAGARAAYSALLKTAPAVAYEGLGQYKEAVDAGTTSARAQLAYARAVTNPAAQRTAIVEAIKLNPAWAEPHLFLASIETDPLRKWQALGAAAQLERRNSALWRHYAAASQAVNKYGDAAKAWSAAERAATSDEERRQVHEARAAIEAKRLEWQEAERRRAEEERQRDLQAVKDKAMAEIRAAEARANAGAPPPPPDRRVVPLLAGEAPKGRVRGRIVSIDCLRGMARFTVDAGEGKTVKLLARDPARLLVYGVPGDFKFGCGAQKTAGTAVFDYFPKSDAKTGTSGEVATIEYLAERAPSPDAPPERPDRKKLPGSRFVAGPEGETRVSAPRAR